MHYPFDFIIENALEKQLSREQWLLRKFTGSRFARKEAAAIWDRIVDHKWYVSERLGRDIGLKVAAIDFVENIYEPPRNSRRKSVFGRVLFGRPQGASVL